MDSRATKGRGRWGAWRVIAAIPSIVCSAIVMLVVTGGLGRWAPLIWVGWLLGGGLTLSRAGERLVVRVGWGFRRLASADRVVIEPVWSETLARMGVRESAVDLYVQGGAAVNAYAVGGRSVAVSASLLDAYRDGGLDRAGVAAVLAHEVGHHRTGGARCVPVILWLELPWRVVCRGTRWIAQRVIGRQPTIGLVAAGGVAVVVAGLQLARRDAWSAVAMLTLFVCSAALAPVVDAALSRADELAADRLAAAAGYGADLARVLGQLRRTGGARGLGQAVWARHPSVRKRVTRLTAVPHRTGSAAVGWTSALV